MTTKETAERTVRDIRRKTRKQYSAEEKIRIVLAGLRCDRGCLARPRQWIGIIVSIQICVAINCRRGAE